MKRLFRNTSAKVLAVAVAFLLWGVSHSTSSIERGFDVPLVHEGVPDDLVITGQSSDTVNIRVRGSRAALRSLSVGDLLYDVDLTGAKAGVTRQEVDLTGVDLPRGSSIVSRSPSSIDFTLERRATKSVRVKPDVVGEPAAGFLLGEVVVDPPRVKITGARSEVLRLNEVATETVDVSGSDSVQERSVKASPGGRHIWIDGEQPIIVRVDVLPVPVPEPETEEEAE